MSKEELYNEAKKHTNSKSLYMYKLEDALSLTREKYKNHVTFIVGSFYIYGTVIKNLEDNLVEK